MQIREVEKLVYLRAQQSQRAVRRELGELKDKERVLLIQQEENNQIITRFASFVCQRCLGEGSLWVSYAQVETKLETCKSCAGTGLAKE